MIYSAFNEIITGTFNLYDVIDFFKIESMFYFLEGNFGFVETQEADFPEVI